MSNFCFDCNRTVPVHQVGLIDFSLIDHHSKCPARQIESCPHCGKDLPDQLDGFYRTKRKILTEKEIQELLEL